MTHDIVDLNNIGGEGYMAELFSKNIDEIAKNILDYSTNPTATRKLTIELTIKPTKDRTGAEAVIKCTTKLAPVKEQATSIMFDRPEGSNMVKALTVPPPPQPLGELIGFMKKEA